MGLRTKLNAVLLRKPRRTLPELASIAEELSGGRALYRAYAHRLRRGDAASLTGRYLSALKSAGRTFAPTDERRGNGPAHYYKSDLLLGRIGFIDAVSHKFCADCNRVRLTSTGQLKPCLCYADSADLRTLIRGGCTDDELREALKNLDIQ